MSIKILRPAVMTTLVSEGREGFRSLGIGPGGAMDYFAMKAANFLVGNDQETVLETGFSSADILFQEGGLIAFTGRGFDAFINGESIAFWKPIKMKHGSLVTLKKKPGGTWAYVAVKGGWKAQKWLNSFTTNLTAKAGGFDGIKIGKEAVIDSNENKTMAIDEGALSWGISARELEEVYSSANLIRCVPSVETDLLSTPSKERFESSEFTVTSQSDRMGYRMNGELLSLQEKTELVSSPVDFGTIQLLPDGNLIVLMADHQTTGGYARIASVTKVDLPKLSQLGPGERVIFKMISIQEAEAKLIWREQKMDELKKICHSRIEKHFQR